MASPPFPWWTKDPCANSAWRERNPMKDSMEGVALTRNTGGLYKWKTSTKDESKIHQKLCSFLQEQPPLILELPGVDVSFVQCLRNVATKKEGAATKGPSHGKPRRPAKRLLRTGPSRSLLPCPSMMFWNPILSTDSWQLILLSSSKKPSATFQWGFHRGRDQTCRKHVSKEVGFLFGRWKRSKAQ